MHGVTIAPLFRFHLSQPVGSQSYLSVSPISPLFHWSSLVRLPRSTRRTDAQTNVCHGFATTLNRLASSAILARLWDERDWRRGSGVGFIFWRTGPLIKWKRGGEAIMRGYSWYRWIYSEEIFVTMEIDLEDEGEGVVCEKENLCV